MTANAEVISYYEQSFVVLYMNYALSILPLYDYILTVEQERMLIWNRKWTGSSWLLVINRYVLLAVALEGLVPYNGQVLETSVGRNRTVVYDRHCRCNSFAYYLTISTISVLPGIAAAVFSALRVYALTNRNMVIASLIFILSLGPVGPNIYFAVISVAGFTNDPILGPTCLRYVTVPDWVNLFKLVAATSFFILTSYFPAAIIARLPVILADLGVIVITLMKTFRHTREAAQVGMHTSISVTLLRDGSIYFIILLVLNIASFVDDVWPQSHFDTIPQFSAILQEMILSHFIFNLTRSGNPSPSTDQHPSRISLPNFRGPTIADVVGDMGQPLDFGGGDDAEDEQDQDASPADAMTENMDEIEEVPRSALASLAQVDVEA